MAKRRLSLLLVLAIMFTMVVPQISASAETVAPEGYRKLLDVQIFKDSPVVGWSGSGMASLKLSAIPFRLIPQLHITVCRL